MKCHSCKGKRLKHTRYCLDCYIKECVRKTLKVTDLREKETLKEQLLNKLIQQNYTCAYTGIRLIPGINMSIDHIFPVSINPEKIKEIDNLIWIDVHCNMAKRNLLPSEFMDLCIAVVSHQSELLQGVV